MKTIFVQVLLIGFIYIPCIGGDLQSFDGYKGLVKIAGGTAHIPIIKAVAKRIMMHNQEIVITVAGGGSGIGIKQVGEGLIDIGNSGRKPKPEEIKRYNLKMYKWALDGVGVVVNPANKVQALEQAQLKAVFAGTINNWKELGGVNHTINIYTRDQASGTRAVFWKKALTKGTIAPRALFVASNGAMKSAVAGDPYGIGYVSAGHIDQSVAAVALDGVRPTLENVKNGKYKIARGLYSSTKGTPQGLTLLLLQYLFTPEGHQIIIEQGFIPVK